MESPGVIPALERGKDHHPNHRVLIEPTRGLHLSYRELHHAVDRTARRLDTAGVNEGDRVGLLMHNRIQHAIATLGLMKRGAVAVPVNHGLTKGTIENSLRDIGVSVVICGASHEHTARSLAIAERVLSMDSPKSDGVSFLDQCSTGPALDVSPTPADDALILFTSGTTGQPKPVRLSHGNLAAHARLSNEFFSITEDDLWLAPLPMYHMSGLGPLIRSIVAGSAVLVQSYEFPDILDVLRAYDITALSLVPTQIKRLLKHPSVFPPGGLRFLLTGGASIPRQLKERCLENNIPLYTSYGMTETTSHVAVATPVDLQQSTEDAGGRLLPGIECSIDPVVTTENETGEIVLRGPVVTPGYVESGSEQRESFDETGFHTGDAGRVDQDGRLHVEGRLDDLINSGGEFVAPAEVEAALEEHQAVTEAVVTGVKDEKWGEAVCAVIESSDSVDTKDLERFCRDRLADFKVPKHWKVMEKLPRTTTGTVRRKHVGRLVQENSYEK